MIYKIQYTEVRKVVCEAIVEAPDFEAAVDKIVTVDKEVLSRDIATYRAEDRKVCGFSKDDIMLWDSDAYKKAVVILNEAGFCEEWLDSTIENGATDSPAAERFQKQAMEYLLRVQAGEDPLELAYEYNLIEG